MTLARAAAALAVITGIAIALPGQARAAGGAFGVDDAAVGPVGECKVESWAAFSDAGDFIGTAAPACVFSVGLPVEAGLQFQRTHLGGVWGTAGTAKAKVNIIPVPEAGGFGLGFVAGVGADLIAGTGTGGFAYVPVTFQVNEAFKINLNAGWLYDSTQTQHWFTWGAGFEWSFAKTAPMTLIAEVYGQTGNTVIPPSRAGEPRFQAGLRFTPVETMDIDLIYGRNITGENANWVTIGLNVRFDVFKKKGT